MSNSDITNEQNKVRQPAYNVELHIDEIVLHGFVHRDRYEIQEAIQRELTRLIADEGLPSPFHQGDEAARLDAGSVMMHRGISPSEVGIQVAQAVYRGLALNNGQPVKSAEHVVDRGRSTQQ